MFSIHYAKKRGSRTGRMLICGRNIKAWQIFSLMQRTEKPFALREIGLESLGVPVVIAVLTLVVLWVGIYPEPLFALITAASF